MTTATRPVDWEAMRREYAGGDRGLTLGELARRHVVPLGTVHHRAAREGWSQDSAHPASRAEIYRRLRQLLAESGDISAARLIQRLSREYGLDHPDLPTLADIRRLMPRPESLRRTRAEIHEPEPINGLRRRCVGCCQLTTTNPCNHCGDAICCA